GRIALLQFDVAYSGRLWSADATDMAAAVELYKDLVKTLLLDYEGFEVRADGEAMMLTFESAGRAPLFAPDLALRMIEVAWPKSMLRYKESSRVTMTLKGSREAAKVIYSGLRLKMGLVYATPICRPDPVTGRMDYFGPVVEQAARLEQMAHPGQLLVTGDV